MVHPVCYITLKNKEPCIKKDLPLSEEYDETQVDEYDEDADELHIEVEEDLGEIEPTATLEVVPTVSDHQREGRQVNATDANSNATKEAEKTDFTNPEGNRQARYIDFIDGQVESSREDVSSEYDYDLEPSEDPEVEFETKTVLVTRIHKYTDHQVTATLIAKNCAPVSPHVPKCKRKRDAVIRERPDGDSPLIIASAVAPATPPEIKFDAKEIVNEEEEDPTAEESIEEEPETQAEAQPEQV